MKYFLGVACYDEFLLQHTLMYFGALTKEKGALDTKLFKEVFSNDRLSPGDGVQLGLGEIESYVESIRISSELWAFQNSCISEIPGNPEWVTSEVVDWMLRLNRLGMSHFGPMILGALNQVSCVDTSETSEKLVSLLKHIERFIFIVYSLCGYARNQASRGYFSDYGQCIFYGESGYSFDEVANEIDEYIYSFDEDGEFQGIFSVDDFINKVHARFHKDEGWYHWTDIKYFLSEWQNHLSEGADDIYSAAEYSNLSVEHIMPQSPNAPGQWQLNQQEIGRRFKYVVHDLGNLTLLGIGANKAVRDIDLKSKEAAYRMSADGCDILKRAGKKHNWRSAEIVARGESMVEFICDRWRLPGQEADSEFLLNKNDLLSTNLKPARNSTKPT